MKDEGAIDWWERFPTSIKQGSKLKEGYQGGEEYLVFFGGKQKKNGGVRKRLVLKYGRRCSWKRCVQTRA
jgi:hypothetical protein